MSFDVVAEKTENLCGYKPTGEQVLSFLKDLKREESLQETHSTISSLVTPPNSLRSTQVPRAFDQIQAVIQLMRNGEIYSKAFAW